jgi:hypothetical protein
MAEPLGIASGVIATIDLSATVICFCYQYSRKLTNAKNDVERLCKQVRNFQLILRHVKHLIEGSSRKELEASRQLDCAIKDGHFTLEQLARALKPLTYQKVLTCFGLRALRWPIQSKNNHRTIQYLACCRGNILLALDTNRM